VSYRERKEIERFKAEIISPEKFTVSVKGFGVVTDVFEFMAALINHFDQVQLKSWIPDIKHFGDKLDTTVADINLAYDDDKYIRIRKKMGEAIRQVHCNELHIELYRLMD
jgi:hypothetical protein